MEDNLNNLNQSNKEMYDYLVSTLEGTDATIEVLDNGGIFVSNWEACGEYRNQLYIPPNLDSNKVSMISYFPGAGSQAHYYDPKPLREKILSENPPDCIITIAEGCDDKGNTMEAAALICEDNGLEITNLTLQTFSASGGVGFQQLEEFLEKHPEVDASMIVGDGYNMGMTQDYFQNLDTLIDKQVPIVLVNPHSNRLDYSARILGEKGLNMYIIESNRGEHTDINKDIINNGLLEYSIGLTDELGGPNNNLDRCDYIIFKYNPDSPDRDGRDYVLTNNFEDIRQENASFGYTLERLETNPFEDGSVGSDMYQVVSSINNIRNCVSTSVVQSPNYNSTSSIPSSFINAETSLVGISSDLNSTIYKETEVIASIAQVFYDMDRERTNAASELSDGSEIAFDSAPYYDVLNQLVNADITGEMHFGQFLFDPGSHVEGNSGKLCASDISSMLAGGSLTGPLHENLENERISARETKKELDNLNTMITTGTNFSGAIWDAVSTRLDEYCELMDLRVEAADTLEEAMVEALTLILDYMGDYEELDDSKLPELRERVEQIKQDIIDAQNIIDATHTVTRTYEDDRGGTSYYYVTEYVYSAGARRAARELINTSTALLREIEQEIVKLEGLPIILAQAEQIVNDALSEVYNKYGVKVGNAVTGNEVTYIPPANTTYTASALPKYQPWTYTKETPEGKVSQGEFYSNQDLLQKYGASYDDYLNGVERVNNPMYNTSLEDKGIEPGQSLYDKILDDDDTTEDVEADTETPENVEEDTQTPNVDNDNSAPQQEKPTSPQTPSQPSTPSEPSTPSQPSEPSSPSEPSAPSQPSEPSSPSEPSAPSQPSEPSSPNEPSAPSQPSEPSSPNEPSTPSQPSEPSSPSEPSTPSQPSEPSTPSEPSVPSQPSESSTPSEPSVPSQPSEPSSPNEPSVPSQPSEPSSPIKPSVPSQPSEPSTPSEPSVPSQPSEPSSPSEPSAPSQPDISITPDNNVQSEVTDIPVVPEDGDLAIGDINNNVNNDIPPIIEIPNEDTSNNDIIDITPPGNEEINTGNNENSNNLIKTVGIISGVGAAVGAAALGAHTINKSKKNDMYEDD